MGTGKYEKAGTRTFYSENVLLTDGGKTTGVMSQ